MQRYRDYAPTEFDARGLALEDQGDWYVVTGRNRDSDILTESNFDAALACLGGESDDVEVHRFGHWACGWLEIILVRPDTEAEATARALRARLENYPMLDESDFCEREYAEYNEAWINWGKSDFVRELQRKLELDDDTADALLDREDLQSFFEKLNSCGDYMADAAPYIDASVRNCDAEDVAEFLSSPAPVEAAAIRDAQGELPV